MNPALREILIFLLWVPILPMSVVFVSFIFVEFDFFGIDDGTDAMTFFAIFALMVMPFFVIFVWLPVWAYVRYRRRARLSLMAPLLAASLVGILDVIFELTSDDGDYGDGETIFMPIFLMCCAAIGAYIHDLASRAWLDRTPDKASWPELSPFAPARPPKPTPGRWPN